MGYSRSILETMLASLSAYMKDSSVRYDLFRLNPNELDPIQYAKRCRIALYQDGEDVDIRVGAYKADSINARYGIDITVFRGYKNDEAQKAELILADYKDAVIDWATNVQPSIVTSQKLMYFGFDSATGLTRLDRSVTQTLRFICERFYTTNQS